MKTAYMPASVLLSGFLADSYVAMATGLYDVGILSSKIVIDPVLLNMDCSRFKDIAPQRVAIAMAVIQQSDLYPTLKHVPTEQLTIEHIEQVLNDVRIRTILEKLDSDIVKRLRPH